MKPTLFHPALRCAIAILLLLPLLTCGGAPETSETPSGRPNFLVLLVDDLGWTDFGCYGSDLYQTPNIDQLAEEGVRFTQGYAACTVCSPSRAALLTGKYPGRTHVTDWIRGHSRPYAKLRVPDWTMKLEHEHTTLAEAMGAAGYRTASVGKWHLMPSGEPDMNEYIPEKHGFEINIGGNEWGAPGSYFHPYRHPTQDRGIGPLPPGGQEGDYLTGRLTDEALKIIENWQDEPFLLYFPYYNVHTPIQAKEEDIERFQPLVKEGMRHTNPVYAAMLASVDRSVGRLRAKLDELGLAENTVIILTGDNGGLDREGDPTENAPLRHGKGSAYEGGVRTPWIAYWPGVTPAGAVSEAQIITMDIYPTVLEIAGVEGDPGHNAEVDGVSLVPVLRDPSAALGREAIYWHYPHYHSQGATPYSAVREGDWRLVEFFEDGHVELYNLAEDGSETKDLASEMPEKAAGLKAKLQAWRESVGAQMPAPNPGYDPARESERAQ